MKDKDIILVLDFGGQYNQLIARRVRECNVYCELLPHTVSAERIAAINPKGIILSGGPNSVYEAGSPDLDKKIYSLGIPVLGICYGGQLIAKTFGGTVSRGASEYGKQSLTHSSGRLFEGINKSCCLMSHSDYIEVCPKGFKVSAATGACPVAAFENEEQKLYGVQFHPEVTDTEFGTALIKNFLFNICKAKGDWTMSNFAAQSVAALKQKIGDKKVLCALSGGVDSSVVAALIDKACKNLICVFVDHGLLRKNEGDEVERIFKHERGMNFIRVNAADRFLSKLKGVTDPEKKRKIIGEEFIRVFEEEAKKIGSVDFLAQGTIYADVVESGKGTGAVIKSHHNVGGLPSVIDFKEIIEPLRELFKDEVRQCGLELGLPRELVMRQPFPGPGLAVRIIGEITEERLNTLREADAIFREEIAIAGLNEQIWQYFAVLTPIKSVGVMGDYRTYSNTVALRAVTSVDAMTAGVARIPYDVLESASNKIINRVEGINRVVYDITSKPPATIEWE